MSVPIKSRLSPPAPLRGALDRHSRRGNYPAALTTPAHSGTDAHHNMAVDADFGAAQAIPRQVQSTVARHLA